jgi:fatty acid desaturase
MAATGKAIKWYRSPVSKADMAMLNQKSDFKAWVQTLGFLAVLATTATASLWSAYHLPWYATVAILFVHGTCWHFLVNGFHELIHESVFKTRFLNTWFLNVYSFLGLHNPVWFWASHTEHHKYTLNPPDDMEVVLPQTYTLGGFLKSGFVDVMGPYWFVKGNLGTLAGKLDGEWTKKLFAEHPEKQRELRRWALILLAGHAGIAAVCCWFHLWMVPVVITGAAWYGGAIHFLANGAQHVGLRDQVNDFRLNTRTIYLNPVLSFLYWNMNYHTEHHMYAAVPCYNLPKLHRLIKDDLPAVPNGLIATWKQIIEIHRRQAVDPSYQFSPELPPRRSPAAEVPAAATSASVPTPAPAAQAEASAPEVAASAPAPALSVA